MHLPTGTSVSVWIYNLHAPDFVVNNKENAAHETNLSLSYQNSRP